MLVGCLLFGMYPSIAMRTEGSSNYRSRTELRIKPHMQSVCAIPRIKGLKCEETEWLLFNELVRGKMLVTCRGNSRISPLSLILMSMDRMGEVDIRKTKKRKLEDGQFSDSDDEGEIDSCIMCLEDWMLYRMKHMTAGKIDLVCSNISISSISSISIVVIVYCFIHFYNNYCRYCCVACYAFNWRF